LEAKVFQSTSITSTFIVVYFKNENDPTTKLLNKLKIDYDIAKEQYLNMTPNEEDFRKFARNESYNDDSGRQFERK
jgi:ATP-dependent Clp protease ATP-binding subunit ClpC